MPTVGSRSNSLRLQEENSSKPPATGDDGGRRRRIRSQRPPPWIGASTSTGTSALATPRTCLHALKAVGPRLRQIGTSLTAPAAVASAFGVAPDEAHLFAETMLLRLGTEFRGADNTVRAGIVRSLLMEYREQLASKGRGALTRARVAEPDQVLSKVKAVYDTGNTRARALALRMFSCLANLTRDSVHVRSLLLSSLFSSSAAGVKAALFAAGCFCKLSEDFSCITLEVLTRSEAQVIVAAIKAFSEIDCWKADGCSHTRRCIES